MTDFGAPPWEPSDAQSKGVSPLARWLTFAGIGAAALGCLLPWARVFLISISGTDTNDGKLFLGATVLAAVLAGLAVTRPEARPYLIAVLVVSVLLVLGALYEIGAIEKAIDSSSNEGSGDFEGFDGFGELVEPGAGLYVLLLGSLAATAGAIKGLLDCRARSATPVPPPAWPTLTRGKVSACRAICSNTCSRTLSSSGRCANGRPQIAGQAR